MQRPVFAPLGSAVTSQSSEVLTSFIEQAAGNLVCLTGAGCSTESGVPDYRSPEGSYAKGHRPMRHQDFTRDPAQRARYWARSLKGWRFFDAAHPNIAHRALAALERRSYVAGVITQNVDRLHQAAGSNFVLDLHGRNDEVECLGCGQRRRRASLQEELEAVNSGWIKKHLMPGSMAATDVRADGDAHLAVQDFADFFVPHCGACGGVWMPRVVFFGGSLQPEVRDEAMRQVTDAHSLLILGSSCQVFSAYRLVKSAADAGQPVALVNIGETRVDSLVAPHLRLPFRCGDALSAVCGQLGIPVLNQ